MPSLSSFWPTVNPGDAALDDERRDAAVAGLGIDGGEDDEEVGFERVRDPELPARENPLVAVLARARLERERVAARPGLGQRVRANRVRREPRQQRRLQVGRRPAQDRVDDQRVLHVDQHTDGWVDAREFLDDEHGMEESPARPAVSFGHLDRHDPEREQLVEERPRDLRVLVHLADERSDPALGKLTHASAQQLLVVGQFGERRRQVVSGGRRHGPNAIIGVIGSWRPRRLAARHLHRENGGRS